MSHCQKCEETLKAIKDRNEATKLWIQSDTQCREYAHSLEKRIRKLEVVVRDCAVLFENMGQDGQAKKCDAALEEGK